MSSNQSIGTPYSLASLPKPISSSNGQPHIDAVCSISGTKKRKRTEAVVGIDGEGLYIYSLQNPRLVTSYALPLTASFAAPPFSVFRKGANKKAPSHRFTYASVTASTSVEKPQLVCFHETILGDESEVVKTAYTHQENPAQLLNINALPVTAGGSTQDATHDVITVFDNGDVKCLSADLEAVRWIANINILISPPGERVALDYVTLASARAITKGLLRSREDVVAVLNSHDARLDASELIQIICVVCRKANGTRMLSLLQVQTRSPDLATSQLSHLKCLLSWDLPAPSGPTQHADLKFKYTLHPSSGSLHILNSDSLLSYDFTGIVPTLQSEVPVTGLNISSFLRTSQDVVFTSSPGVGQVFDVKFNSLQASFPLQAVSGGSATSRSLKRKLAQSETNMQFSGSYNLVTYFSDINLMIAFLRSEIIGIQFKGYGTSKRVRISGPLLIDALGKGCSSDREKISAKDEKWQLLQTKLNQYVSERNIAKFENVIASQLGIEVEPVDGHHQKMNEVDGGPLANGISSKSPVEDDTVNDELDVDAIQDDLQNWKSFQSSSEQNFEQYHQCALYALGKIFQWSRGTLLSTMKHSAEHGRGRLIVDFFAPNVFQWLLHIGYLTKESISRSLSGGGGSNRWTVDIRDGDIVQALVDFDPDLHILSAVLSHSMFLPAGEVAEAIRVLLESIDDEEEEKESPKHLTNGDVPSDDEMDVDVASELEAASEELDHALSLLDHGLVIRSQTIRSALIRLNTFPASTISTALRTHLSTQHLGTLTRILHLELRNGGWTSGDIFSAVQDPESDTNAEDPDDYAVTIIASLLNSTLDAIGAPALVASAVKPSDSIEHTDTFLVDLREDASHALNAFWEARFVRGLLGEFLRYAAAMSNSQKPTNEKLQFQNKPFQLSKEVDNMDDLPMLPLGARADIGVNDTKAGKGGRRDAVSKREMGMRISKRVPKYSFERIEI